MNLRYLLLLVICLGLMGQPGLVSAADPVISNIDFQQRTDGSGILEISYDLHDADGDTCAVALQLSVDNGITWDFPALNLSGDVGETVFPGEGKMILCGLGALPVPVAQDQVRARVVASDTRVQLTAHSPSHMAVMDLSAIDWSDPQNLDKFSQMDLLILTGSSLWEGGHYANTPVIEELKARNSNLVVVGYVSAFSAKLDGETAISPSFWNDWYFRTRPYWSWTTEGDTVQTWPGNAVIDITNPDARAAMVETIVEYQESSNNHLDGIYWDYFNNLLWVYDGIELEGDIDMDGDGIPHAQDQDERLAYQNAQVELVTAVRDSMGDDFLQIFNGQRAYGDPEFAALADGVMYEIFPTLFFPEDDMAHALDPDYENNLFNVRSWLRESEHGPFLVMSNTWQNIYWDQNFEVTMIRTGNQFRAVALLVDGFACWNSHDGTTFSYTYGAPEQNINLGQPLGAPSFEDNFIRREFQFGKVELEMGSGTYPNPFDYRIWCLGQLVEVLAIPYHSP